MLSELSHGEQIAVTLSADDIVEIHETLVDWFAQTEDPVSPAGIASSNMLLSAVGRPTHTVNGKDAYPTLFDKAAALFHSLVNNHAFHNGNKRIALVSAQVSLAQSGYWIEYSSDEEMYEFARMSAAHEITKSREDEIAFISTWFDSNSRKSIKGEHPLKYHELRDNLKRFGYDVDPPEGELLNVYKNGNVVERISKQGIKGFRPYHTDYISGLRKRLGLIPSEGIDSVMFYGRQGVSNTASQFIELRIEVMRRLAKT